MQQLLQFFDTIAARFWDQIECRKIEKINIKIVITYNNISLCQISVYFENFRLWDQFWSKEWIKKLGNFDCFHCFIVDCFLFHCTFHCIFKITTNMFFKRPIFRMNRFITKSFFCNTKLTTKNISVCCFSAT